jgi:hypothetical protein
MSEEILQILSKLFSELKNPLAEEIKKNTNGSKPAHVSL